MIELRKNDLIKYKEIETGDIEFSVIIKEDEDGSYRYLKFTAFGYEIYYNGNTKIEILAVWRYDEETGNYLKIYDKDMPYINDPKFRNKQCKPADVPYDKYISLEQENAELRNIIVELNKKLYGE